MEVDPKAAPGATLTSRLVLASIVVAVAPLIAIILLGARESQDLQIAISIWQLAAILLGTLVFSGGVGLLLSNQISRQIRQLARGMRFLGFGDFTRRLRVSGQWGLGTLASDYNAMAARLETEFEEISNRVQRLSFSLHQLTDELNALAVDNARLRAEAQQQGQSVSKLQEFSSTLPATPAVDRVCGQLIEAMESQLKFDIAYVWLTEDSSPQGVPVAVADKARNLRLTGRFVRDLPSLQSLPGVDLTGQILQGSVLRITDQDGRTATSDGVRYHLLGVPLGSQDRHIGAVVVAATQTKAFSKQDERVVTALAAQAAMAIDNIRLLEEASQLETLRELDRLKSELISTVSHELRTPLASIKGYISTLLRPDVEWDESTRAEFLQIVDEESDRLQALIDNLLQMSRIDAGMLRIDKQPIDLGRLIHKVVRKARVRAPDHRVAVLLPSVMPEVDADVAQMEQVISNLLDNAIKYSPSGSRITIRGEATEGSLKVSVSDEGIGIGAQHLGRIFERFYRADTVDTKRVRGTGLGLSICRGIVEAHGGQIYAESSPGHGSTFSFVLPIETAPPRDSSLPVTSGG